MLQSTCLCPVSEESDLCTVWCQSAKTRLLDGDAAAAAGHYDLAIETISDTFQHLLHRRVRKRRALNDYTGALQDAWKLHALDPQRTLYCLLICELLEARCDTAGLWHAYEAFSAEHPELVSHKKRELEAQHLARRVDFVARLPRETICLIMSQLTSTDRHVCFNVSTRWRAFMASWPGTWHTLAMSDTGCWYLPYHRPIASRMLLQRPIQPDAVRTLIYKRDEVDDEMSPALEERLTSIRDLNLSLLQEIHCDFSNNVQRADFAVDPDKTPLYLMQDIIYKSAEHLTHLCFRDVRLSSSGAWWSTLFERCPHLTDLTYIFSNSAVQEMRDELQLTRPTQLTSLQWHADIDMPFNSLLPFCPQLQRLVTDPPTTEAATRKIFTHIKRWCPSIADLFLTAPDSAGKRPVDPDSRLRLRFSVILSQAEPVAEFIVRHASELSEITIMAPIDGPLRDSFCESFRLENSATLVFPRVKRLECFETLELFQCHFPILEDLRVSEWDGQSFQDAQRFPELVLLVLVPRLSRAGADGALLLPTDLRLSWTSLSEIYLFEMSACMVVKLLEHMEMHPMLESVTWKVKGDVSMEALNCLGRLAPNLNYLHVLGESVVLTSSMLYTFTQWWPSLRLLLVDNIESITAYGIMWLQLCGIIVSLGRTNGGSEQYLDMNGRDALLRTMHGTNDKKITTQDHFCLLQEFEEQ